MRISILFKIGGVPTNFRMPNTLSIPLGGGSIVTTDSLGDPSVAPISVGYKLLTESLSFGGKTLTATDIAVSTNLVPEIPAERLEGKIDRDFREKTLNIIRKMVEEAIDQMKVRQVSFSTPEKLGLSVSNFPKIRDLCHFTPGLRLPRLVP